MFFGTAWEVYVCHVSSCFNSINWNGVMTVIKSFLTHHHGRLCAQDAELIAYYHLKYYH